MERLPGRIHPEGLQRGERPRHESLAARLVDVPGPGLPDLDVEPGAGGVQRGHQPGRAAPGDEQVDRSRGHEVSVPTGAAAAAAASARRSVRIRTVSRPAFASENTVAVIHADPASGSARPSTTTAA